MRARRGDVVVLRYALRAAGGTHTESSGEDPVEATLGAGELLPGLEGALEGLEAGSRLELTLAPHDAFGAYDPEQLTAVPLDELPPEAHDLRRGDWLPVVVEEDDGTLDELELRVLDVSDEAVYLDANHPLAGQEVVVEVELLEVRAPG